MHQCLAEQVGDVLQKDSLKIAIASDIWTSRTFNIAVVGMIDFWISSEWKLNDTPLDIIPLNGDHSGSATGKLMHTSLT